jgi:hypothetical protein
MANKNQLKVNGKSRTSESAYLTINLADDSSEVRGFGKPVTREKAKDMAEDYFKSCDAAWNIIKEIESNSAYSALKALPEFQKLKGLIDPDNQTVSGVFGKEIILQILSMRDCEGLRYIYGKDNGKNTVILIGVGQSGTRIEANGSVKAMSAPVVVSSADPADMPLDGEVHDDSLTITGVRNLLSIAPGFDGDPVNVLFGSY